MLRILYHNEILFVILFWKGKCKLMYFSNLTLSFFTTTDFIIVKI